MLFERALDSKYFGFVPCPAFSATARGVVRFTSHPSFEYIFQLLKSDLRPAQNSDYIGRMITSLFIDSR